MVPVEWSVMVKYDIMAKSNSKLVKSDNMSSERNGMHIVMQSPRIVKNSDKRKILTILIFALCRIIFVQLSVLSVAKLCVHYHIDTLLSQPPEILFIPTTRVEKRMREKRRKWKVA